jgi:hypothetical protein
VSVENDYSKRECATIYRAIEAHSALQHHDGAHSHQFPCSVCNEGNAVSITSMDNVAVPKTDDVAVAARVKKRLPT